MLAREHPRNPALSKRRMQSLRQAAHRHKPCRPAGKGVALHTAQRHPRYRPLVAIPHHRIHPREPPYLPRSPLRIAPRHHHPRPWIYPPHPANQRPRAPLRLRRHRTGVHHHHPCPLERPRLQPAFPLQRRRDRVAVRRRSPAPKIVNVITLHITIVCLRSKFPSRPAASRYLRLLKSLSSNAIF